MQTPSGPESKFSAKWAPWQGYELLILWNHMFIKYWACSTVNLCHALQIDNKIQCPSASPFCDEFVNGNTGHGILFQQWKKWGDNEERKGAKG